MTVSTEKPEIRQNPVLPIPVNVVELQAHRFPVPLRPETTKHTDARPTHPAQPALRKVGSTYNTAPKKLRVRTEFVCLTKLLPPLLALGTREDPLHLRRNLWLTLPTPVMLATIFHGGIIPRYAYASI